jgi:hypothetical protein
VQKIIRTWLRLGARMIAGAVLLAGVLAVTPSSASADIAGEHLLQSVDERCLEAGRWGDDTARLRGCSPDDYTRWWLQPSDNGTYRIVNGRNRCLEVEKGGLKDRDHIVLAKCNSNWQQQWWVNGTPRGRLEFANRRSEKCMDVQSTGTPSDTLVWQYGCHGGPNQEWILA